MARFKLVAITLPHNIENENGKLEVLASRSDIHAIHLRKPSWTEQQTRDFLLTLSLPALRKIRLHRHHRLIEEFPLQGLHLTSRDTVPRDYRGPLSASCHTLSEVEEKKPVCDYVFLSPIFDSISKADYKAEFTEEQLREAAHRGIIDSKVVALGGITPQHFDKVRRMGFGGAALMGALWGAQDFEGYAENPTVPLDSGRLFDNAENPTVPLGMGGLPKIQFITHPTEKYSLCEGARMALSCGIRWVQFRCKNPELTPCQVKDLARRVQQLCQNDKALFVIDDRVELALELKADGVHLGKDDMAIEEARRLLGPDCLIGGTANTLEDMLRIEAAGGNYIGLGPFRFTTTKQKLSPVLGLEGYQKLMGQARASGLRLPIYAIGGITPADADALRQAGVDGLAVSSSILRAEDPKQEVEKFKMSFISCRN